VSIPLGVQETTDVFMAFLAYNRTLKIENVDNFWLNSFILEFCLENSLVIHNKTSKIEKLIF